MKKIRLVQKFGGNTALESVSFVGWVGGGWYPFFRLHSGSEVSIYPSYARETSLRSEREKVVPIARLHLKELASMGEDYIKQLGLLTRDAAKANMDRQSYLSNNRTKYPLCSWYYYSDLTVYIEMINFYAILVSLVSLQG